MLLKNDLTTKPFNINMVLYGCSAGKQKPIQTGGFRL